MHACCLPFYLPRFNYSCHMSVLELKQEITRLNRRGREDILAYLVRLKHETPEWKCSAARRIDSMKKGQCLTSDQLETRVR